MSKHTQGKWAENPQWKGFIIGEDGKTICQVAAYNGGFATRDANTARILACVNACEGVPTEVLENTVGPLGAFKFVQDQRDIYRGQVEELREECRKITPLEAQRDELLAALEDIIAYNVQYAIDRYGDASNAETMACVKRAREAIARAKGGAA